MNEPLVEKKNLAKIRIRPKEPEIFFITFEKTLMSRSTEKKPKRSLLDSKTFLLKASENFF